MDAKRCTSCKQDKPLSDFNKNKAKADGLNTICRPCSKECSRRHYRKNPKAAAAKSNDRRRQRREQIALRLDEIKVEYGCQICKRPGHPCEFDFHHLDKDLKGFNLAQAVYFDSSDRVAQEVNKCIVLCARCHRLVERGLRNVEDCRPCSVSSEQFRLPVPVPR